MTPTTTNNPQTSTRIFLQDNPYTFEERHARLSEPLEPVQRQASLIEPTYTLFPTLPQDLNRIRHNSQNQNAIEVNRQSHFNIPQSPTPTTSELSSSTLPETPTLLSQHSISNIPLDYLGSTPTSQQSEKTLLIPQTQQKNYHIGQHFHIHKLNRT